MKAKMRSLSSSPKVETVGIKCSFPISGFPKLEGSLPLKWPPQKVSLKILTSRNIFNERGALADSQTLNLFININTFKSWPERNQQSLQIFQQGIHLISWTSENKSIAEQYRGWCVGKAELYRG